MGAEPLQILRRSWGAHALPDSLHPVLRRIYAGRGLTQAAQLSTDLRQLLIPGGLLGLGEAAAIVADAVRAGRRIVIAGDYDADGATGVALAVLGLRALGAGSVGYVVPDRFTMGYGLSRPLVELAAEQGAELLVTVDSGISSIAGAAAAKAIGLQLVITDHHLPGSAMPQADAIVNPNQPGCTFGSKNLAGVGVMFYLLSGVRAALRAAGWFVGRAEPLLADFLDLVAVGTVADVARLDHNNRILVAQGLARLRAGRMRPGLRAMLHCAGRDPARLTAMDLGFVLGPRINAAGRLDDIGIGIECLLADTEEAATPLAHALEQINRQRREITQQMTGEAEIMSIDTAAVGVCLFEESWHEGIVGLVASRLKERLHRPVIAFARAQQPGLLKGSARSISGLHIRDALAAVDAAHPGLIERFGGHAMAAGLSIREQDFPAFAQAFDACCAASLGADALQQRIETDGELSGAEMQVETAVQIENAGPWGQGFAEPSFENGFEVLEARPVGADQTHVKYRLRMPGHEVLSAIHFGGIEQMVSRGAVRAVYALGVNRYNDSERLDLRIAHLHRD